MASSLNNPAWLQWMATVMGDLSQAEGSQAGMSQKGVSRRDYAATLPPDRFYCLLDELPLHLIPQRTLRWLRVQENKHRPLYLNPECFFCTAGELPDELASQQALFSGFACFRSGWGRSWKTCCAV
jgi:hypothetical protein